MKKVFAFLKILVMGIAMVFVLSACVDFNTEPFITACRFSDSA